MSSTSSDPTILADPPSVSGILLLDLHQQGGGIDITLTSRQNPDLLLTCHSDLSIETVHDLSNQFRAIFASINLHGDKNHTHATILSLGHQIFRGIFSEPIQKHLQDSPCEYLILQLDPGLVSFPWELLSDGAQFFGCRYACGRLVPAWESEAANRPPPGPELYCLVVTNPTNDLPESGREGASLVQQLSRGEKLHVEWLNGHIEKEAVLSRLAKADILHYSGHGTKPASGERGWVFTNGILGCADLRSGLQNQHPPRLVFSNACHAAEAGGFEENGHSAMLECFIRSGGQHFIGTLFRILDRESREFSNRIYSLLLSGKSIGQAIRQARLETQARGGVHDLTWAQYVLFGDPAAGILHEEISTSEARTGCLVDLRNAANGRLRPIINQVHSTLASFPHSESLNFKDGMIFCSFLRPSDAVRFAIRLVSRLQQGDPLAESGPDCRIAIHDGEMFFFRHAEGGRTHRVEGGPIEILHDLVRVALPRQILLSKSVFDNARQVLHISDLESHDSVTWLNHGAFRFKGRADQLEICEVGEVGAGALRPPPDTSEAWRCITPDDIPVLGWRPGLDQEIPSLPGWTLVEKLGEGGFGEVWRGKNGIDGEIRVFKFCFRADRARSLIREANLFRHLRQAVGNHPNIVQIYDVYVDEPPYFISMENVPGQNLSAWAKDHLDTLPLESRLEMVASIADALQVAHDAGIIHRDVKPTNILVVEDPDNPERYWVKLSDFGIGQINQPQFLLAEPVPGYTDTLTHTELATLSGSRFYMAPELLMNHHASIRSDIYSLGVILFQMIRGDLRQPLTVDWRRDIHDPLTAEDIDHCTAGNPQLRYSSASELARNLRNYTSRKQALALSERARIQETKRKHILMGAVFSALLFLLLGGALGYGLWREQIALKEAQAARRVAEEELYISSIKLAEEAIDEFRFGQAQDILLNAPKEHRNWEWGYLFSLCHQDRMTLYGHAGEINSAVFSPEGSRLYTAGVDGTIRLWDASSGAEIRQSKPGKGLIKEIKISGDGTLLAAGYERGVVDIIDTADWHTVKSLVLEGMILRCLDLSSDGRLVAAGCEDGSIHLYDLQAGKWISSFKQGADPINDVALSKDNRFLASCGSRNDPCDCMARLWDAASGELLLSLQQWGYVQSVAFSPDGNLLAVGGMSEIVFVYDRATGNEIKALHGFERMIRSIAFSPDGKRLAAGSNEGIIRVWHTGTWEEEEQLASHQGAIDSIAFSPDSQTLASAGADGTCRLWPVRSKAGNPLVLQQGSRIRFTSLSPDESTLAVCGLYDAQFPILQLPSLGLVREQEGYSNELHCGEYSPDSRLFAAAGLGKMVRIWRVDTGELIGSLSGPFSAVSALRFSKDGQWLAIGEMEGVVRIWKTTDWHEASCWDCGDTEIQDLDWSPDSGKLVVAETSPEATVWQPFERQRLMKLTGHSQNLRAARFSPDGRFIATASDDSTARLWDSETGKELQVFEGHTLYVLSVAFSPDGQRLFTASEDSSCKVWEVGTGRELISLHGHQGPVHCLAYSPRHRYLITGADDNSVRIWPAYPWDNSLNAEDGAESLAAQIENYKNTFYKQFEKLENPESPEEEAVDIPDPILEQALRQQAGKKSGPLTKKDLGEVRYLNLAEATLNLNGIQYCSMLNHIRIDTKEIKNISLLHQLPSLRFLYLFSRDSQLRSFGEGFSHLLALILTDFAGFKMNALEGMNRLQHLSINGSGIEDISPIAELGYLESLTLIKNRIHDLTPLRDLSRLRHLNLAENRITDLSALKGLTCLTALRISLNQVSNPLPLMVLSNLNELDLSGNPVNDLKFASRLKRLHQLDIRNTPAAGQVEEIEKLRRNGIRVITGP